MLNSQDSNLFKWVNNLSVEYASWNPTLFFFAAKMVYVMALILCIYWLFGKTKTKKMILQAALSVGIALLSGAVISHFVPRDRPFVTFDDVNKLIAHTDVSSFPSQHTLIVFALAGMVILHRKWEGTLWIIAAALVGFARIWCGVHYPGDILFGAIVGFMSALIVKTYLPAWTLIGVMMTYILRLYNYSEQKFIRFAKEKIRKK